MLDLPVRPGEISLLFIDESCMVVEADPIKYPWFALYNYWRSCVPAGATAPCAIDAAESLPEIAENLSVISVLAKEYRYEFFGKMIAQRLGADLTGKMTGGSSLVEAVKISWHSLLDSVARRHMPRLVRIEGGEDTVHYLIALPTLNATGKTGQIIVGVFFDPRPTSKIVIRRWQRLDLEMEIQALEKR
jgi:hypothetical protein